MAQQTLTSRIIIRNDTSSNWQSANPVLLKGELGIETDTGIVKYGDGVKKWNQLTPINKSNVTIQTQTPSNTDSSYDIGTLWIDTTNDKGYIIYDNTASAAIWKQIVTPDDLSDLGAGDMLKSQFANNPKVDQGYVNAAIVADTANAVKNSTPSASNQLTVNDQATGADESTNNALWTANKIVQELSGKLDTDGTITGGQVTITPPSGMSPEATNVQLGFNDVQTQLDAKQEAINLTPNYALVSGADGEIEVSSVTSTELGYLSGVTGGIQSQIDSIPKYNYLNGVAITVDDGAEQNEINSSAVEKLNSVYTEPSQWDACSVQITFTPSDVIKDGLYYYNGSSWVFLYYLTTGVQVANGATAGIVESSDDISFVNGKGTIASNFIKNTNYATNSTPGIVQGSTAGNGVSVGENGVMTVGSSVLLSTDTFIINGGTSAV